jgi:hypothetical protein
MSDLVLAARIDPSWNRSSTEKDLSAVSEEDLRYSYLLGDVELRSGDIDLSASWGWVPLLDFVASLIPLLRRLPTTRQESFEFTESGSQIRFYLMDDCVEIRTNYKPGIICIPYEELMRQASDFAVNTMRHLRDVAPSLDHNPVFRRISDDLSST